MEFTAAVYTWKDVFNYPAALIRPLGFLLLTSVVILNIAPPPSLYGRLSCYFYHILLGGAIYTWFVNYKSPKHSLPLFFSLLFVTIISSSSDNTTIPDATGKKSNIRSLLTYLAFGTLLPLCVGFFCGPLFIKLGQVKKE